MIVLFFDISRGKRDNVCTVSTSKRYSVNVVYATFQSSGCMHGEFVSCDKSVILHDTVYQLSPIIRTARAVTMATPTRTYTRLHRLVIRFEIFYL